MAGVERPATAGTPPGEPTHHAGLPAKASANSHGVTAAPPGINPKIGAIAAPLAHDKPTEAPPLARGQVKAAPPSTPTTNKLTRWVTSLKQSWFNFLRCKREDEVLLILESNKRNPTPLSDSDRKDLRTYFSRYPDISKVLQKLDELKNFAGDDNIARLAVVAEIALLMDSPDSAINLPANQAAFQAIYRDKNKTGELLCNVKLRQFGQAV